MTIVVDLDGTLANNAHREHLLYVNGMPAGAHKHMITPAQWEAFHDAMDDDAVFNCVNDMLNMLEEANADILILTARKEKYRYKTIAWLDKHCPWFVSYSEHRCPVIMKPNDLKMPAPQFKLQTLIQLEAKGQTIDFCLEDQMDVTRLLRKHGFVVFNVRDSHS